MKQKNLVFLCGPHGSGKTTLVKEIARINMRVEIPELFSRNPKFNLEDVVYRQGLKICSRAIENFEYSQIANKNPNKIILGNRCVYDILAYNEVFFKRGWISEETLRDYNKCTIDFFNNGLTNPYAIVLNPGFEVVLKHLKRRWEKDGKKWREEDLEYARLACEAYEQFKGRDEIFYINHEINLESRQDIQKVNDWINSR